MYVCMYVCMCMYVCACMYVHVCMYVCMYGCMVRKHASPSLLSDMNRQIKEAPTWWRWFLGLQWLTSHFTICQLVIFYVKLSAFAYRVLPEMPLVLFIRVCITHGYDHMMPDILNFVLGRYFLQDGLTSWASCDQRLRFATLKMQDSTARKLSLTKAMRCMLSI